MNQSLQSKIFEYKLLVDLIQPEEVAKWADDEILKCECPPSQLCELSLTNDKKDQLRILAAMSDGSENQAFEWTCVELNKLYSEGELNFFEVVNKLLPIYWNAQELDQEYSDFCSWVDDEASLASLGVKELESSQPEMSKFLARFTEKHA